MILAGIYMKACFHVIVNQESIIIIWWCNCLICVCFHIMINAIVLLLSCCSEPLLTSCSNNIFSFHCHWRIWAPRGVRTFICLLIWKIYSCSFCNGLNLLLHMWSRTGLSGGLHQFCINIYPILQQGLFHSFCLPYFFFVGVGIQKWVWIVLLIFWIDLFAV